MAPRNATPPLEETVVDFVRKSEEAVLEVGRKWAEAIDEFVPVEVPLVRDLRKQVFALLEELPECNVTSPRRCLRRRARRSWAAPRLLRPKRRRRGSPRQLEPDRPFGRRQGTCHT